MTQEQLRELLWWAFRAGDEVRASFEKADGNCLDLLDEFQNNANLKVKELPE